MKTWQFLTIVVLGLALANCGDYPEEDGVLVLSDANFDAAIAENERILVEFYAPWCGHCKKLAPHYSEAAGKLKEHGVFLAKVDATENADTAGKFEVRGYPTLKWFVNGSPTEYTGGREANDIVNWVIKKSGPATTPLADAAAFEKFTTDNEVAVVFFGESTSEEAAVYEKVAMSFDDVPFATSTDAATAGVTAPAVVLYKNFDEGKNTFEGAFNVDELKAFVDKKSVPTIMLFNEKAAQKIFGEENPGLFVFRDASTEVGRAAEQALVDSAEQLKDEIFLSKSGVTDGLEARLAEYIGVGEADLPTVRIIDTRSEGLKKFVMTEEISSANLVAFYNDWKAGKLEAVLKSEDIPATNDEPVKIIVGKSFADIVLDETKNVLVEFYAPWCGHCKSLAPKYDELAIKVAGATDLVIAKMDSTANEVEGLTIKGFPTLKFFPKGADKTPIDFDGEREVEGFMSFFADQGIEIPETKDDL